MEKKSNSIGETSSILSELESKLCYRKENCFLNQKTKNFLNTDSISETESTFFIYGVGNFYTKGIDYLKKWTTNFTEFTPLKWMVLNSVVSWKDVETSLSYFSDKGVSVNEGLLIDQFQCLEQFLSENVKSSSWCNKS